MSKSIAMIVGVILLVVLVLFSMTYTVRYNEVAILTRFGKAGPDSIVRDPGLHLRLPLFADKITPIDTRLQVRESALETIQTIDGQQLLARAFMLWRVQKDGNGPLDFFTSHPTGIDDANQQLGEQFGTAVRIGLSRFTFDDLIGTNSKLDEAEQAVLAEMKRAGNRGIEPVSVGISQLILPAKTTTAVLQRMQATRTYLSDAERYRGDAEAKGIESRAAAQAEKIRAFANQRAEEIRAEGNKDAAKYIELMGQDQGLAIFLSWLDALQSSLSERTTFITPTWGAPFHLLRFDNPTDKNSIPLPVSEVNSNSPAKSAAVPSNEGADRHHGGPNAEQPVPGGS